MSEKSSEEKNEEYASLLRQGAGNYAQLCGVLAGFVAVIMILVLTPGFFAERSVVFEFVVILFSVSSFGYIMVALFFIGISTTPLWLFKSFEEMKKEFAFGQSLVLLLTLIFLGGASLLNVYFGAIYVAAVILIGFILILYYLVKDWWALAKRPPPKKNEKGISHE